MIEQINKEVLNVINSFDEAEWFMTVNDELTNYKLYNNTNRGIIHIKVREYNDHFYYKFINRFNAKLSSMGGYTKLTLAFKFYLFKNLSNIHNIVPIGVMNVGECNELKIYKK